MNPARAFGPQLVGGYWSELVGLVHRPVRGRGDRGGPVRAGLSAPPRRGRRVPQLVPVGSRPGCSRRSHSSSPACPRRTRSGSPPWVSCSSPSRWCRRSSSRAATRTFPGSASAGTSRVCVLFFIAMISAVLYFDREPSEASGAASTTTAAPTTTASATTTTTTATAPATTTAPAGQGDATAGKAVFASAGCGGCHTLKAAGLDRDGRSEPRPAEPPLDRIVQQVDNGGGPMPAFKGQLTAKQIQDVAAYVYASTHSLGKRPQNGRNPPGGGTGIAAVTSIAGGDQGEPARRIFRVRGPRASPGRVISRKSTIPCRLRPPHRRRRRRSIR